MIELEGDSCDDAVRHCEVGDGVECNVAQEDSVGAVVVAEVHVRLLAHGRACGGVEREVIGRADDRVAPVAPVDSPTGDLRSLEVEAVGGLDTLVANSVGSGDRSCGARMAAVREASFSLARVIV